ncbi:murein transglycosylase A [Chroococcidiopsis sp. CCNUC1]|uniref:murein transglycosylase A n=1 Tax=Chroococcidiopsis sp. CCNUC1 TaxID=2653189 RepID=UPI002022970E|nr:murein transglycosylase A [Chroococcidiopsis sp. CCNUC1]URD47779.1 murein transglycosylase A [Chroococcidiopsis sp. CCNUC1]
MMKQTIALFTLVLAQLLSADVTGNASTHTSTIHASAATVQLVPASIQQKSDRLGWDEQIWGQGKKGDRQALLKAIDNSLRYLRSPQAIAAYQQYPLREITRERVWRSLVRFRQLVINSHSPEQLQAAVQQEFELYQFPTQDGKSEVLFTAYYEPIYPASRVKTAEYRYPLYRLPPDFASWTEPHPTRAELEGENGLLGAKSRLHGRELVWLRDRLEAFLVHIQGSARLHLTDGSIMTVGYAGKTEFPYTSIGKELIKDGKLPADGLTLPAVLQYFRQHPAELNTYLPRYRTFVFFQPTNNAAPHGYLGVPVTAERSIATDKSLTPPGALALIHTQIPYFDRQGQLEQRTVSRYVLNQDTGSAIKGAGRVDYFMGTGDLAAKRAGVTVSNGQLYYLLLKGAHEQGRAGTSREQLSVTPDS